MGTENYYSFYLTLDGTLYANKKLRMNAFESYIDDAYPDNKDYIPILTDILEIAITDLDSALVLDFKHDLYGLGSNFNREDPDELIFLADHVSRVWSRDAKYYYMTDDLDIYMFDLNTKYPKAILVYGIDVPEYRDSANLESTETKSD